jgi:hypothetical protein
MNVLSASPPSVERLAGDEYVAVDDQPVGSLHQMESCLEAE